MRTRVFALSTALAGLLGVVHLAYSSWEHEQLGRALLRAAGDGDVPKSAALLARGADLNARIPWWSCGTREPWEPPEGWGTPLAAAAADGRVGCVELLLAHGAAIDGRGVRGRTPLMEAVISGQVPAMKVLLAHGADVNAKTRSATALKYARRVHDSRAIRLLVQAGARE